MKTIVSICLTGNDQSSTSKTSRKHHLSATGSDADMSKPEKQPTLESPARLPHGSPANSPQGSPSRPGAASPDPNCAICLEKLENKSFTDSCFHQFCFVCLLEWSKVKAECPLCKQTFKSIIHNIRSNEEYDQYHIPRPEERDPLADLFGSAGRRFRYRTTVTDHRYYGSQALEAIQRRIEESIEHQRLERPSRRHYPASNHRAWRALRQAASSSFRRGIYLNGLKAKEPANTRRRFRQTSPEFFRENTACTHRLVPWLNRELNAVLEGREDHVAYVLDLIMGLIKRYNIDSEEFFQHVYPFIGRHTRHFMHEFLMFAKSPYHMAAYDQHVVYEPTSEFVNDQSDTEIIHHSDDNESDVEIIHTEPPEHQTRSAVENAPPRIQPLDTNLLPWESSIISMAQPNYSYFNSVISSFTPLMSTRNGRGTTSSGWESPIPGPSWTFGSTDSSLDVSSDIDVVNISNPLNTIASSTIASSSIPISQPMDLSRTAMTNSSSEESNIYRDFLDSLNLSSLASTGSQSTSQTKPLVSNKLNPVVCSDSDSDAVMIVNYEKPWEERSPIQLSTDNSSDCDLLITGTTNMGPDKRVKKCKKKIDTSNIMDQVDNNVSEEKHSRKRKHRSRSRSLSRQYKPRHYRDRTDSKSSSENETSRSRSPLLFRFSIPQYRDKFSKHYRIEKERRKPSPERRHKDSHRSDSNTGSRSKRHRNRSVSSSSSNGEHVSFRSHKHKSSSGMEITEYFKKKVKRKKSKKSKHRSSSPCDLSSIYHHKKKKKSKDRYGSKDRAKRHRHKHKHERLFQSALDENIVSGGVAIPPETHVSISNLCASVDAISPRSNNCWNGVSTLSNRTEFENRVAKEINCDQVSNNEILPQQNEKNKSLSGRKEEDEKRENTVEAGNCHKTKPSGNENIFSASKNLEFVEMLPSQAGMFDKELDSLAQLFPSYSERLDSSDNIKLTFKKHPRGHKKSSKLTATNSDTSSKMQTSETDNSCENQDAEAATKINEIKVSKVDDIQMNTVTSCTDPETQVPLPSNGVDKAFDEIKRNLEMINTDSDISACVPADLHSDGELIDVEGNSDTSDADVLKICEDNFPCLNDAPGCITLSANVFHEEVVQSSSITNADDLLLSDSSVTSGEGINLDVEHMSDSGSDTVKYAGVELAESPSEPNDGEIDVTGVSDSETITYVSEANEVETDNGSDIDVLGIENEDVTIEPEGCLQAENRNITSKEKHAKTLCLDSDSEGIDLDYQCEHSEETDDLSGCNTAVDEDMDSSRTRNLSKLVEECENNPDQDV